MVHTTCHVATDVTLESHHERSDPWREIACEAAITDERGDARTQPLFWAGGRRWVLRVSRAKAGRYQVRTTCSDTSDAGLHGREFSLDVAPVSSSETNPLRRHGPVRMSDDGRHFAHADGTPFFWLGDTWWMQMSDRVRFPDDFTRLVDHRAAQGFNVVQTVVGFPPDLDAFDRGSANEGGFPWEPDCARINPAYFDRVDARLAYAISRGIVPCILGAWGYHLRTTGEETMTSHWKYLLARYGAWPVVWCLAGETAMPHYLAGEAGGAETQKQREVWARIGQFVRATDSYRRPLTTHPRRSSWDDLVDSSMLDFHMLQLGHMGGALAETSIWIEKARREHADKPVVNGEPPYEGHGGTNGPDVQRYSFWASVCCGVAGFTYGAAGVFQANDRARPTPLRPDGGRFDRSTWDEALHFDGVKQVVRGAALLRSLPFERLEPHADWVQISLTFGKEQHHPPVRTYCLAIPRQLRLIYLPLRWYHWVGPLVTHLEAGVRYAASYINPATFEVHDAGIAVGDEQGRWQGPNLPYMHDWLVILKAV